MSKYVFLAALLALGGAAFAQIQPASTTQTDAQTTVIRIVEAPKDGAEPVSTVIRPGALKMAGSAGVGKAMATSFLTLGFGGTVDVRFDAFGEFADKTVGGAIKEIRIDNFDPKAAGAAANLTLLRFGVDDGVRYLRLGGSMSNEPNKMHTKKMPKSKLTRDAEGWLLTVSGPLEPGHYVVMSPSAPSNYWDFDVR